MKNIKNSSYQSNKNGKALQIKVLGKWFIFSATLAVIILALVVLTLKPKVNQPTAVVNGQSFNLEIASTQAKQIQGLSGRPSLAENTGMLFVYRNYQDLKFWMKDMQFPLDIIWIKDKTVVGVTQNIPLPGSLPLIIYPAPEPVNFVLELNAGLAEKYQIQPGDQIFFDY